MKAHSENEFVLLVVSREEPVITLIGTGERVDDADAFRSPK